MMVTVDDRGAGRGDELRERARRCENEADQQQGSDDGSHGGAL